MSSTSDPRPSPIKTSLGTIAVTREGPRDGPVAICIHGIPGSVRDFRYLAPALADSFHVVRVDAPGFGDSPRGDGQVRSVEAWGEALHAVADTLELRRPYVLVGHSFGGGAALHAAAYGGGRAAGLVLISAPGPRRHRAYFMPRWGYLGAASLVATPLLRQPVGELGRWGFRKLGLRPPARGDWRAMYHLLRIVGTLRFERLAALAPDVCCPTLLCHCVDDPLVEVGIAEQSAALFADCERLLFDEGGHYPQKHHAVAIGEAIARRFG